MAQAQRYSDGSTTLHLSASETAAITTLLGRLGEHSLTPSEPGEVFETLCDAGVPYFHTGFKLVVKHVADPDFAGTVDEFLLYLENDI